MYQSRSLLLLTITCLGLLEGALAARHRYKTSTPQSTDSLLSNGRTLTADASTAASSQQPAASSTEATPSQAAAAHRDGPPRTSLGERIAHGRSAKSGQFPFMASIYYTDFHTCGGTLINSRVLLTAAHCVVNPDTGALYNLGVYSAKIGVVNHTVNSTTYKIKAAYFPPSYNSEWGYGDIALLLLDKAASNKPVTLTSITGTRFHQPAYLAIGWGFTNKSGLIPDVLQTAALSAMTLDECQDLSDSYGMTEVPSDHFCLGGNEAHATTCNGDSGGPVLASVTAANGVESYIQTGLTSYGPHPKYFDTCGGKADLGVYTSVSYWRRWIEDTQTLYNMRGTKPPVVRNKVEVRRCQSRGTVLKRVNQSSPVKCLEACKATAECKAWSWDENSKICAFRGASGLSKKENVACTSGTFVT